MFRTRSSISGKVKKLELPRAPTIPGVGVLFGCSAPTSRSRGKLTARPIAASASRALPLLYTILAISLLTTATLTSFVYQQDSPPPHMPLPITRVLLRTTEDNGARQGLGLCSDLLG